MNNSNYFRFVYVFKQLKYNVHNNFIYSFTIHYLLHCAIFTYVVKCVLH